MGRLLAPIGPNAVHLCIDMQRLFEQGAPWATPWMEQVTPQVAELCAHVPACTVFTRFIPPLTKDDARGVWKVYYQKWENVTRARLDPALLELTAPLARFAPPGLRSSTGKPIRPSAMAN
jgi:nicotinamidase-related amidase